MARVRLTNTPPAEPTWRAQTRLGKIRSEESFCDCRDYSEQSSGGRDPRGRWRACGVEDVDEPAHCSGGNLVAPVPVQMSQAAAHSAGSQHSSRASESRSRSHWLWLGGLVQTETQPQASRRQHFLLAFLLFLLSCGKQIHASSLQATLYLRREGREMLKRDCAQVTGEG